MFVKLDKCIRRYSAAAMWTACSLIAFALVSEKVLQVSPAADVLYCIAFILSGVPILLRAVQALKYKTVSIELLVSIAAIGACFISEYSESAIVTFLFQFGSWLEQKTMKKTRNAIRELTQMAPKTAWRVHGEDIEEIDVDEIDVDDTLLVKTGGQIPCDGFVIKGEGYVVEASITGESVPAHKNEGDHVYAGTILDSGTVCVKAVKVGEDTTFSRIIELVEEAQDAKSPIESFINRFAKYYTPAVILMAILVFAFTKNLDTAITVLVLACPGALVIGAPIANVAGIGRGAQEGILLKGGDSIHTFSRTDTVVFDKTGTLTAGCPQVVRRKDYSPDAEKILECTAAAESVSDHPVAKAITRYTGSKTVYDVQSTETQKGMGLKAVVNNRTVFAGNVRMMESNGIAVPEEILEDVRNEQNAGASTVLIASEGKVTSLLSIADAVKPDAAEGIQNLKRVGIKRLIMLSGDNSHTAELVAKSLGINEYVGEMLPQDKLEKIREFQKQGHTVTFAGDGINDSPAMTAADTGIAMGSGTDVAIDCSDVVLIKSDIDSLVRALELSRKTVRILYQNIFIAIGTVILLLAGLFAGYIHMSVGMLIHEASILCVILNAMRLLKKERLK